MITLVRNCAHGSEVVTCRVDDERGRRFVKVALTPDGRAALDSEIAGWAWYQARRFPGRPPICRTLRKDAQVVRIEIHGFDGVHGRAADGLAANAALLAEAVEQYCAIWSPSGGIAPMHGDFSCDNLIRTADGVMIIDWENFHAAAPWGFDALYLLFETLYFDTQRGIRPADADLRSVAAHVASVHRAHPLSQPVLEAPLASTLAFIRSHAALWHGELERHPMKLPIVALGSDDVRAIDMRISALVRTA